INGLTYFAAVCIIDNNSAINYNTAFNSSWDLSSTGVPSKSTGLFPSGVGLVEILRGATAPFGASPQFTKFFNAQVSNAAIGSLGIQGGSSYPVADGSPRTNRTDFQFAAFGDARNAMMGSRLLNPGYWDLTNNADIYAPVPIGESAALSYRSGLVNPLASPTNLESVLSDSLYYKGGTTTFQSVPYPQNSNGVMSFTTDRTYNYYQGTGLFAPLRPIAVSTNPVTNLIPVKSSSPNTPLTVPATLIPPGMAA